MTILVPEHCSLHLGPFGLFAYYNFSKISSGSGKLPWRNLE